MLEYSHESWACNTPLVRDLGRTFFGKLEKLNAMPLGMPDYREPEKLQVVDWREKLKKEAADDNPMNKLGVDDEVNF